MFDAVSCIASASDYDAMSGSNQECLLAGLDVFVGCCLPDFSLCLSPPYLPAAEQRESYANQHQGDCLSEEQELHHSLCLLASTFTTKMRKFSSHKYPCVCK